MSQAIEMRRRAGMGAGPNTVDMYIWDDGNLGWVDNPEYSPDGSDVITSSTSAPRARLADELSTMLRNAGGKVSVGADSSLLIVALNNSLRFSVARAANGAYEITEHAWGSLLSGNTPLYIGAALLVLMALGGGAIGRRY